MTCIDSGDGSKNQEISSMLHVVTIKMKPPHNICMFIDSPLCI